MNSKEARELSNLLFRGFDRSGRAFEGMTPQQIKRTIRNIGEAAEQCQKQQELLLKHFPDEVQTIYLADGENISSQMLEVILDYKTEDFKLPTNAFICSNSPNQNHKLELEERMHQAYLTRKRG